MQPLKLATSNLVCNLGLGLAYEKKQCLGPKLAGLGPGKHLKKSGIPFLFLQPTEKWYTTGLPCQTDDLGDLSLRVKFFWYKKLEISAISSYLSQRFYTQYP